MVPRSMTNTSAKPTSAPPPDLHSKLARLKTARVVVVGDLVADEYVYGETDRVSREAPVPVVQHEFSEVKLGGAANVVANVAALGAEVWPVGVVGGDAVGDELLRLFEAAGAEPARVLQLPERFTETKTRILAGGRSTSRQQLLRLDRADTRALGVEDRKQLLQSLRQSVAQAGAVVVSDYGSGLVDEEMREFFRELASEVPVCVDSRYGLELFQGISVAKPNEPELEALSGVRIRSEADVEKAARALLKKLDAKAVLVTRGRLGMQLVEAEAESRLIPPFGPSHAVDVTGAGDTVLATFSSGLAAGLSMFEAAWLANVAGGLVVQKPGTATCSFDELEQGLLGLQGL